MKKQNTKPEKRKIVLRTDVCMCSGVCCAIKTRCYRFLLNQFYDTKAYKEPHPDPVFINPVSSGRKCAMLLKPEWLEDENNC